MAITFSVIIPTRNGERYIGAAVESALNQMMADVNVIVLESGSTDRTLDIVRDYDDPRLQVLSASQSLDMAGNWARIVDLGLNGYMTILGHDDVLYPNFFEAIARLIQAEPGASLYCTHFHFMDAASNVLRSCVPIPYIESAESFMLARHQFKRDSNATGYVMRAADYCRIGGVPPFPQLIYADDIAWYRLSKLAYKVCSPEIACAFRMHDTNASHLVGVEQWYWAAKAYMLALDEAGYMSDPIRRSAARRFVEFGFNGHAHNELVKLIESGDSAQMAQYRTIKARILADYAEQPLFTVYDRPSWVYERVFALPGLVRKLCLVLIRMVRALRRWVRRQHDTAMSH